MKSLTINDVMHYDRKAKSWTVDTGEAMPLMFGSGPCAKALAYQAAVKEVEPALYRMAEALVAHQGERVASRVWKACSLVLSGDVTPGDNGAIVRSQSNAFAMYSVTITGRSTTCSCLDVGLTLSNGQTVCKHVLATIFAMNLARQEAIEPAY